MINTKIEYEITAKISITDNEANNFNIPCGWAICVDDIKRISLQYLKEDLKEMKECLEGIAKELNLTLE